MTAHRHLTGSNLRFGGFLTRIENTNKDKKSLKFTYREIHPYFIKVYYSSVKIKINEKQIDISTDLEYYDFQLAEGEENGLLEFTTELK